MKLQLTVVKGSTAIYQGVYDISDAAAFGRACADLWVRLADRKLHSSANVGALYEAISDSSLHDLDGVQIRVQRVAW